MLPEVIDTLGIVGDFYQRATLQVGRFRDPAHRLATHPAFALGPSSAQYRLIYLSLSLS